MWNTITRKGFIIGLCLSISSLIHRDTPGGFGTTWPDMSYLLRGDGRLPALLRRSVSPSPVGRLPPLPVSAMPNHAEA